MYKVYLVLAALFVMIPIDGGRRMGEVMRSLDYFVGIVKKIPTERLLGFTDGMQDASSFGRLSLLNDSTLFSAMKWETEERIGKVENINLTNYFGAYANGYLMEAGFVRRGLDLVGVEKAKYSCAMKHLEIPFREDGERFRSKDNVYEALEERGVLVYDDRVSGGFEPRFRLEI